MVGVMMAIEMVAYTMRLDRGRIAVVEMRGERNSECDYIRNVRLVSYRALADAAKSDGVGQ